MAGAVAWLIAATGAMTGPGSGLSTTTTSGPSRIKAHRTTGAVLRCPETRTGLEFWKDAYARHRAVQGLPGPPDTERYDCEATARRASEWRIRATIERVVAEAWVDERTLTDGPWEHALEQAQRVFPGTYDALLRCSLSEGYARGRDEFVWNREGSGAFGPMQFLSGTFWRMWGAARDELDARGFRYPTSAASHGSNLGQALAAAWGFTNGRRREWSGAGC